MKVNHSAVMQTNCYLLTKIQTNTGVVVTVVHIITHACPFTSIILNMIFKTD